MNVNRKKQDIKIIVRPFAREVIARLAQHFTLVAFTASIEEYAQAVVSFLDPEGRLFSAVYSREHCTRVNGKFIKGLGILNTHPDHVILVDNSCLSFVQQLSNGVPILPFFNDSEDRELLKL